MFAFTKKRPMSRASKVCLAAFVCGTFAVTLHFLLAANAGQPGLPSLPPATSCVVTVADSDRYVDLFALGDWGTGTDPQRRVATAMEAEARRLPRPPDAVLLLGDNFYKRLKGVADPKWESQFESMYDKAALPSPFFALLGNHDCYGKDKGAFQLSYAAEHPGSRWKMPARWYRIELPAEQPLVTILMLDSNFDQLSREMWAEQTRWLTEQLSQPRSTPWLIVAAHHPLYSHGDKHGDAPDLIRMWGDLLRNANVDFYLCGHDHHLEHIRRDGDPIDYLISGGGGAGTRGVSPGSDSRFAVQWHGFLSMRLGERSADVNFISDAGTVIHSFSRSATTRSAE